MQTETSPSTQRARTESAKADSVQRWVRHQRRIFQAISIVIGVPAFVMIGVSSSWWTATGTFLLLWAINIDNALVKK